MKKLLFIVWFIIAICVQAQVGVLTPTPQNTLHVNGSMQVVKDLNVGGTADTKGNSGNPGEFLSSNGPDQPPVWKNIESENFLKVVFIGLKNNISGPFTGSGISANFESYSKNFAYNVINKIDNSYINYNASTGVFTIVKPGYYNISTYITQDLSLNPNGFTNGTATSVIQKGSDLNYICASSTGHGERTESIWHQLIGIRFFNAGETFRIRTVNTQNFRLTKGNIYVAYLMP